MRTRYNGLGEGGKVGVWGIVIASVFSIVSIAVQLSGGDGTSDAKGPAATSAPQPPSDAPTGDTAPNVGSTPPKSDTPTSAPPARPAYKVAYRDQTMSLGLPSSRFDVTSLDFDAPGTRQYARDDWSALTSDEKETGNPVEPDLSIDHGELELLLGRNAARLDAEKAHVSAEDCARHAQVGGFTVANLYNWEIEPKTVLCVVTDKGNIVRAQVNRIVGGKPGLTSAPPKQIEFTVTLWNSGT